MLSRLFNVSKRHLSFRNPYQAQLTNKEELNLLSTRALEEEDYFNVGSMVTMADLFERRVHLGHGLGKRHRQMEKYVMGTLDSMCVINLEMTLPLLKRALNFVSHIAYRNGIIVFANERPHFMRVTQEVARECGEYFVTYKWTPGTLTNPSLYLRDIPPPDTIILFNTVKSNPLIKEAIHCCIPLVTICDSDTDPTEVMYPIPGNDDTPETVIYYKQLFKTAVIRAKYRRREDIIRYRNSSE